tara:strand:+ start:173 stop:439 length:267 start_codon:yes stop_codon:yes gene_type:complete
MPNVKKNRKSGGMKFPYTPEGIAQAKQYSMQSGGKVEMDSMEMGGMIQQYMHGGMAHSPMKKMMGGGKMNYGKKMMGHGGMVYGKKKK